jgi:hypothetical protein
MRYDILDSAGTVLGTLLADEAFMRERYPFYQLSAYQDPAPSNRRLTHLEYMDRFTQDELRGIYGAAKVNIDAEIWLDKFRLAGDVDLDDPRTAGGLAAVGLSADRIAEILK